MADNTKQSADETIATDDIGGVKFQRMKLTLGGDGENAGDVAAGNPMPVSAADIQSLIETMQELTARLAVIASWANSGAAGMRVVGVSMPSTAVTGPQTSAQFIASHNPGGVNYPARTAMENMAAQANINNCTGA